MTVLPRKKDGLFYLFVIAENAVDSSMLDLLGKAGTRFHGEICLDDGDDNVDSERKHYLLIAPGEKL